MKKTLIITGGEINTEFAEKYCEAEQFDCCITADNGLRAAEVLKITPDYIVGDFDTLNPSFLLKYENRDDVVIRRFRPEKDFTDTHAALSAAIEEGSSSIHILGGTGSRIDHMLANILLLQMALENDIEAVMAGENNRIRLLGGKLRKVTLTKGDYRYVSLLPLTPVVANINTTGMKYNVKKFDMYLNREISRGVSNEILDKEGEISIDDGILIVIESKD